MSDGERSDLSTDHISVTQLISIVRLMSKLRKNIMIVNTETPARDMFCTLTEMICTEIMNSEEEQHAFITGILMGMTMVHYDFPMAKTIADKVCTEFEKSQEPGYNGAEGIDLIRLLAQKYGLI